MAATERTASGVWRGNLKEGDGAMTTPSGALREQPFSFATRFGDDGSNRGSNPEELIAAAHAGCYSMAFANHLTQKGYRPQEIRTRATTVLEDGGIHRIELTTEGHVEGLDAAKFASLAEEANRECPVSNLLGKGAEISVDAKLKS